MKVFFAPDYREGVAYQALLAEALAAQGIEVTFPHGHRRVLPLSRGLEGWNGDLLHIHWPEKFFERRGDGLDFLRKARFPLDLALTTRRVPIVLTAHDLRPHNRGGETLLHSNFQRIYRAARTIIAHSEKAADEIALTYGVKRAKLRVIPHGDLSASLGPLPPCDRRERICLMFGTVEPYKGIEPVIDWWRAANPDAVLAIVGKPFSPEYGNAIRERAGDAPNIRLDLAWQTEDGLKKWLSAADCALFHYRAIFTSGAACLARSLGIPILIPNRLDTVDLAEPHPSVFRFETLETDFRPSLEAALAAKPNYAVAAPWREATAWPRIAEKTAQVYGECVP